jgi:hypothetical protein
MRNHCISKRRLATPVCTLSVATPVYTVRRKQARRPKSAKPDSGSDQHPRDCENSQKNLRGLRAPALGLQLRPLSFPAAADPPAFHIPPLSVCRTRCAAASGAAARGPEPSGPPGPAVSARPGWGAPAPGGFFWHKLPTVLGPPPGTCVRERRDRAARAALPAPRSLGRGGLGGGRVRPAPPPPPHAGSGSGRTRRSRRPPQASRGSRGSHDLGDRAIRAVIGACSMSENTPPHPPPPSPVRPTTASDRSGTAQRVPVFQIYIGTPRRGG